MKYINVQFFICALFASTIIAEDLINRKDAKACWLKVGKLCADQIKTRKICATEANLQTICSEKIRAKCASFEKLFTNSECVSDLKVKRALVDNLASNTLCAQLAGVSLLCTTSIVSNNVCVNGNVEHCTCWKGVASINPAYTYTLGDPIIFNNIIDDPCLNFVQTATEGTVFVAPRSGYYIVDLEIHLLNLAGAGGVTITGAPVVSNLIVVNGLPVREGRYAFLSFSNDQINDTTAILKLNKGDKIGGRLNIIVQDPILGQIPFTGTVTLDGALINSSPTSLSVHYLSSNCPVPCNQPCPSLPCQPVVADCPQISVNCDACDINCCCEDECDDCDTDCDQV